MARTLLLPMLLACPKLLHAQSPIPPPVSTDLNAGVPGTWTVETLSTTGWMWASNVGYGGGGGLIMDCGTCLSYQETTLWSPWLDLSADPLIDVTFTCAIIGGSMLLPPPVWVRRDDVGGPYYLYRYGVADLIPPPDEVIPSTIDPFPPLDLASVDWISITYPFYAGLNDDSVRIGIGTGVPLGGYALLDEVAIGGISTSTSPAAASRPIVIRNGDDLLLRFEHTVDRIELMDVTGRPVRDPLAVGSVDASLCLAGLPDAIYFVRAWVGDAPVVISVRR